MKKAWIIIILFALALLIAGSALADNHPVNPHRKDMVAADQLIRELRAQRKNQPGLYLSEYLRGLNVTCNRQPTLYGTGSWSISLVEHSASDVQSMIICMAMKDWSDEFTHVHWISKDARNDDGDAFMNSYTTPEIVTAGEYEVYFYITYTDGDVAYYFHEFTISGTDRLQAKISSVASSCKAATQWQTALNIHDWLTHNMYYDLNYEFYGADSILRGYGVCDSYSKLYLMICKAAGIPAARVTNDNHAWNAIRLDGEWYYVDCTWDDPSGGTEKVSGYEGHGYFCLNEEILALDHPATWEWFVYSRQSCTSLAANYTVYTGEWKKWGDYDWNYETGNYCVHTLTEQIEEAFGNGESRFVIDCSADDLALWYMEGDSLEGFYVRDKEKAILSYALSNASFTVEGGSVLVKIPADATAAKDRITIVIAGWDIAETGTLKLPKKLAVISDYAFMGNDATTLIIQDECKTIGAGAFMNSRIRTVTIPLTVTQIAADAFAGCERIMIKTNNEIAIQFALEHNMLVTEP